jgi:hypothetical protein
VATSWLQEIWGGSELKKSTPAMKAIARIKQKSRSSNVLAEKKGLSKNSDKEDFLFVETFGGAGSFLAFFLFDFINQLIKDLALIVTSAPLSSLFTRWRGGNRGEVI